MSFRNLALLPLLCLGVCACSHNKSEVKAETNVKSVEEKLPPLPDPPAYQEAKELQKAKPSLEISAFHALDKTWEQPEYSFGNKRVAIRRSNGRNRAGFGNTFAVELNQKQLFQFAFNSRGGDEKTGECGAFSFDEKEGLLHYENDWKGKSGDVFKFTYDVKPLPDSKLEISYDLGSDMKGEWPLEIGLSVNSPFEKSFSFGGKKYFPESEEALKDKGEIVSKNSSGDFEYESGNGENACALRFEKAPPVIAKEEFKYGKGDVYFRIQPPAGRTGKIVLDLGVSAAKSEAVPAPLRGTDFWKLDALDAPVAPTRNIFPNPSFESGLRYWRWGDGGAPAYVPGKPASFEIREGGLFGKHCLYLRQQRGGQGLRSFPVSIEKGKTYTFSLYAKADEPREIRVPFFGLGEQNQFGTWHAGDNAKPDGSFKLGKDWQRFSRSFTAKSNNCVQVGLAGEGVWVDGLQLEEGATPTEFVNAPVDGNFVSSDPDNDLDFGKPIDAALILSGKPGLEGKAKIAVVNAFRETVFAQESSFKLGPDGETKIALPLDEKIGQGVFDVRADYSTEGVAPFRQHYRLNIMKWLNNTHATKNITGTMLGWSHSRMEEIPEKEMHWGFGSTSWGWGFTMEGKRRPLTPVYEKKFRFANFVFCNEIERKYKAAENPYAEHRKWEFVSPEIEKSIEAEAAEMGRGFPKESDFDLVFAWGNEEEGSDIVRKHPEEYFKIQRAFAKGILSEIPNARISPTNGTSGYSQLRGYDGMESYLAAAQKNNFRYTAISVHPYWDIDKGSLSAFDLDEETQRLIAQMAKYGYGKETPIYFTECFNVPYVNIPQWGAGPWGDSFRGGASPTYAIGNREFIQAASAARLWIICLKHWPHLQSTNLWTEPYMDIMLTPIMFAKAANTIGNLMPWVEYLADARPVAGVRGYVFKLKDGTAIAPVWCVDADVENGFKKSPKIEVDFKQKVRFFDLMGNERSAEVKDGLTQVQLSPAPLFIKAESPEKLAKALQTASTTNSQFALQTSMLPDVDGNIVATIENKTGREQAGTLSVAGKDTPYKIAPAGTGAININGANQGAETGKMYEWINKYSMKPVAGEGFSDEWNMKYFYVPHCEGKPDWSKIPSLPLDNYLHKANGVVKASYQLAWDSESLYIHVKAIDKDFLTFPEAWNQPGSEKAPYVNDGAIEIYFDCGANGRSNHVKTYDKDDYRYDLALGKSCKSGPGVTYRFYEVNWQFANGGDMPTKEAAAKGIVNNFTILPDGYEYDIAFAQKYIEPLRLKRGSVAGFGLFLHNRDKGKDGKIVYEGVSNATEPGSHCDYKPQVWPLMILK